MTPASPSTVAASVPVLALGIPGAAPDLAERLGASMSIRHAAIDGPADLVAGDAEAVVIDARRGELRVTDLCQRLRQRTEFDRLPLVVLTAPADAPAHTEVLRAGADAVVDATDAAFATATIEALVRRARRERASIDAARQTSMAEAARLRFDLDAFAYAVSHDLRAPVRSIDGFSAALVELLGADLDAKPADYLQRVRAAARKLADMIDGLLELSRISRGPLARQQTDLSAQVRAAAASVGRRHPCAPILTVPAGLEAVADPGLVQKLFERVVDNCCKFTAKGTTPAISIDVHDTPGGREYAVRDNGVGFDPAHAARLFRPFQRLHSASEFPGLGVGLAVVQRIVERHGGRVAIDSRPGAGTTVRFTLTPPPANDEGGAR